MFSEDTGSLAKGLGSLPSEEEESGYVSRES